MPYEKLKKERYKAFGGINSKISPYLNTELEFLSLENVDFQTPGSLKKRWGSTQLFGASLSGRITGLFEYTRTSGESYFIAAAGGTMGYCFENGFSSIFSFNNSGGSFMAGVTFFRGGLNGFTDVVSLSSGANIDFVNGNNNCYFANGVNFLKLPNSPVANTVTFFGLPEFKVTGWTCYIAGSGGLTGIYYFKFAWINSQGVQGTPNLSQSLPNSYGISTAICAITSGQAFVDVRVFCGSSQVLRPPNYDILNVGVYMAGPFGTTLPFNQIDGQNYYLLNTQYAGVAGSNIYSYTYLDPGSYLNTQSIGITLLNTDVLPWNWYQYQGFTYTGYNPFSLQANVGAGVTLIPTMFEINNDTLFLAGMTTSPSTVWFSENGELEHFEADFNFEVISSDGEAISALKAYNGNLYIFKQSSFHVLSGNDPSNYVLNQISVEYGCLGNRAIAQYSNYLVFLDKKGVIRYNGANIDILSTKIDPIFQRMNVTAAKDNSSIVYDKQRNELLVDIPVDGATYANLTCVYDIIQDAWTTYKGYNPAVTSIARSSFNNDKTFYGGYSGLISYFGASFTTDNGVGFTCVAKSGFMEDLGNSVSKLFRRLYMDVEPVGASSAVGVNFYQDYGSSMVLSRTMYQSPFQSRLEYGISGKALSIEFVMGSTYSFTLHGFTMEYRFLRDL